MKLTVITSTYNCRQSLIATINSIREQENKIQWVIADGGSTDGTVEAIKENMDVVSDWFSEPDNGIYDAWNKAWKLVKGDWVLFLGAGDVFYNKDSVSMLINAISQINNHDYSMIYGNVLIVRDGGVVRYCRRDVDIVISGPKFPNLPCHQGVLHNVRFVNRCGELPFDATYRITADGKLMLKLLNMTPAFHLDEIITKMADDGISSDHKSIFKMRREVNKMCSECGIYVSPYNKFISFVKPFILYVLFSCVSKRVKNSIQDILDKRKFKG